MPSVLSANAGNIKYPHSYSPFWATPSLQLFGTPECRILVADEARTNDFSPPHRVCGNSSLRLRFPASRDSLQNREGGVPAELGITSRDLSQRLVLYHNAVASRTLPLPDRSMRIGLLW